MGKYTKEDIIFYTEDLNIDELIDKECYFSDSADILLKEANEGEGFQKLIVVDGDSITPFIAEDGSRWTFIIVKKVEYEYVPFVNAREFIEGYMANRIKRVSEDKFTDLDRIGGMWLTIDGEYLSVTDINDIGIKLGTNDMIKNWGYIFRNYKFLDDSYCGKRVGS